MLLSTREVGYRRVINTKTGNTEVLAADGKLYLETSNGVTPKTGGNLAGLVDGEKNIAGAKGNGAEALTGVTQKQLDKKFKHASDFGVVTTKKNPETLAQYEFAIKTHMASTSTIQQGTYGFVKDSKVFLTRPPTTLLCSMQ